MGYATPQRSPVVIESGNDAEARALAAQQEHGPVTLVPDLSTGVYVTDVNAAGDKFGLFGQRLLKMASGATSWTELLAFATNEGAPRIVRSLTGWASYTLAVVTSDATTDIPRLWLVAADGLSKTEVTFPTETGRDAGEQWFRPLADGVLCAASGILYLAEYQNSGSDPEPEPLLWAVAVDGSAAAVAHEATGTRHLHAIRQSPTTGDLYLCAGDGAEESRIYHSEDGETWAASPIGSSWRAYTVEFLTDDSVDYVYYGEDQADTAAFHRFPEGNFAGRETSTAKAKGALWAHVNLGGDIFSFSAAETLSEAGNPSVYVYHTRDGVEVNEVGVFYGDTTLAQTGNPARAVTAVAETDEIAWLYILNAPGFGNPEGTSAWLRVRKLGLARQGSPASIPITLREFSNVPLPSTRYIVDVDGTTAFGIGGVQYQPTPGQVGAGRHLLVTRAGVSADFTGYLYAAYDTADRRVFYITAAGLPSFEASSQGLRVPINPSSYAAGSVGYHSSGQQKTFTRSGKGTNPHYWSMYRGEVTADPANLLDGEWWLRTDTTPPEVRWRVGGATYRLALEAVV